MIRVGVSKNEERNKSCLEMVWSMQSLNEIILHWEYTIGRGGSEER